MSPPPLPPAYEVERVLGVGAQGTTVLAREIATQRLMVVKVMHLRAASSWREFDLFERECKVLRSLSHPAIPAFVEMVSDEAAGLSWLVMEYVDGESLGARIRDARRYSDAELRDLLDQLLDVLEYLHDLNPPVFHRDIKPDNVVRGSDGKVWLVDFGGVRAAFRSGSDKTVVGTFGYMAPEQLRGEASPATDLYGLGATIAAVAAGVDASDLPTNGLEIDVEGILKPGPIRRAVQAMLAPDPRQRARSVADVRACLREPATTPAAAVVRRRPAVPARPETSSWVFRPLFRSPQFVGPIATLSVLAAVLTGTIVAFPIVFLVLVGLGVPIMHGVRRGLQSEE